MPVVPSQALRRNRSITVLNLSKNVDDSVGLLELGMALAELLLANNTLQV